jgi:hypothetical protein
MFIERKIIDKSECNKCKGNEVGYSVYCLDCCARLIMSAGRKGADKELNKVIVQQRNIHFAAIEAFERAPKRKQIEEHILKKYS